MIDDKFTNIGDPHVTSLDGTYFHYMGSGYFDYLKACDDDSHIPFVVTARQDECRGEKTCVREAVVSVYDEDQDTTTLISFESGSGI